MNRCGALSAADKRYDFQFIVVDQNSLIERFSPYDSGISLDRDTSHVKLEGSKEPGYRQPVGMLGPLAVDFNTHAAIMHLRLQRVKTSPLSMFA